MAKKNFHSGSFGFVHEKPGFAGRYDIILNKCFGYAKTPRKTRSRGVLALYHKKEDGQEVEKGA